MYNIKVGIHDTVIVLIPYSTRKRVHAHVCAHAWMGEGDLQLIVIILYSVYNKL